MKEFKEIEIKDSIFRIGKVISVDGRTVKISVDKKKNSSNILYKGHILKNVSVGGYVKIVKGFIEIVGKVEGEYISEDKHSFSNNYKNVKDVVDRCLIISLLGYFKDGGFKRGIKELPLIDNECYLLDKEEFSRVHNFVKSGEVGLTIGRLSLEKGQEIQVGIDSLFASHIGIFGNTGSGKSYTLAKLYRELFKKYKDSDLFKENAKFFIIDFNGEYVGDNVIIDKEHKNSYELSTRLGAVKFPVSSAMINDSTFWTVILEATEKTQMPFLRRAINNEYYDKKLVDTDGVRFVLKDIINRITDQKDKFLDKNLINNLLEEVKFCLGNYSYDSFNTLIKDYREHLIWHDKKSAYYYFKKGESLYLSNDNFKDTVVNDKVGLLNITKPDKLSIIRLKIVLKYFDEIVRGYSNQEHLSPLIKRLDKRIKDLEKTIEVNNEPSEKNITIVSLKDVNIHMRKILPMLFCKQLYDAKKECKDKNKSLHIIIDEAHNILSHISDRESETWKDYRLETFEEIIKEGRKFGCFLTISSQRPSDISPTILSQLHNYFLHRLINNNDIKAVERTISYLDKNSFEYLSILPTGTCVLAGLTAQVPVVLDIGKIKKKYEPDNKTISLVENW
jgi:DNA helicase HerA-like ATPase